MCYEVVIIPVFCDICHSLLDENYPFVKCFCCEKVLCELCNTHELCPHDYNVLPLPTQLRIINLDDKFKKKVKDIRMFETFGTPFLFILGLSLISLGPEYILCSIIGTLAVLTVSAILFSFYNHKLDVDKNKLVR